MKTILNKFLIIFLFYYLLVGCSIRVDLNSEPSPQGATLQTPSPTYKQPVPNQTPTAPSIPNGWNTYCNNKVGFEISFPSNYSALDDAENLYGWKNGVVLIYDGGQSYDIAIQLWKSKTEYENEFSNRLENITIYKVGNQFLTIINITQEPENAKIIATFRLIK